VGVLRRDGLPAVRVLPLPRLHRGVTAALGMLSRARRDRVSMCIELRGVMDTARDQKVGDE
jgi:hypothetical protein